MQDRHGAPQRGLSLDVGKRPQNATGSVSSAGIWGDEGERFVGWHDADVAEGAEGEEVLVAGDDEIGTGGERTSEHGIIVGDRVPWAPSATAQRE